MLIRRCILYVFVLLQCLAPLLHAHADGWQHGGTHLPASLGVQSLEDCAFVSSPSPAVVAVTPGSALQARLALPSPMVARGCLPLLVDDGRQVRRPLYASIRPAFGSGLHLIPLPGAPPKL